MAASKIHARHGHTRVGWMSPEYRAWDRMIQRCTNPKHVSYPNYGGRGITVCKEWRNFTVFLADMGLKPSPRHSLDRANNQLGYSKKNCAWVTKQTQINNRRTTIFVDLDGECLPLGDACRKAGISYNTAYGRITLGWPKDRWFT